MEGVREQVRIEGDREPGSQGVPDSLSPSILACSLSPSIVALAPRRSQGTSDQGNPDSLVPDSGPQIWLSGSCLFCLFSFLFCFIKSIGFMALLRLE